MREIDDDVPLDDRRVPSWIRARGHRTPAGRARDDGTFAFDSSCHVHPLLPLALRRPAGNWTFQAAPPAYETDLHRFEISVEMLKA
jgi:hypothetical protein